MSFNFNFEDAYELLKRLEANKNYDGEFIKISSSYIPILIAAMEELLEI